MKKWLKLCLSLAGSIIALVLAKWFNIFSYMTFIPKDKQYDVCIAVYFTLLEMIIAYIYEAIEQKVEKEKAKIHSVIHLKNEGPNLNSVPEIRFNEMGMAEFYLHVELDGMCKKMDGCKIRIQSFIQGDMQLGKKGSSANIDNDGNFVIDLEKICGQREDIHWEEDYRIVLQRGVIENGGGIVLKPELVYNTKKFGMIFKSNKSRVMWEEH